MEADKRDVLRRQAEAMKTERATWMAHWAELSRYLLPRAGRYFRQDRNRGERRHNAIYDNTGTRGVRVLSAGMMSGMTSPARPWFRLATPDQSLNKQAAVRLWLADVTRLMLTVFAKSNTYRALHQTYEELGVFGTAAKIVLPDFKAVIHHSALTAGEYCLATDYKGNVDSIAREWEMTVEQVVAEFGLDACSQTVRNLWDRQAYGQWVPIVQVIAPRTSRDPGSKLARDMAWRSTYWEQGSREDQFLRDSGHRDFPALCSRWAVSGGDIYGNSPGQEALGDVKQLQQQQLRKGQAIDYKTKPPLQVPASMKNAEVDILPGGISYYDGATAGAGIRTAFDVNLDLSHLLADIQDVRERIKGAFYADLWLMLERADMGRMTATEVAERKEEKLLMLGPTTERLHNEELGPLIETTFSAMVAANMLPPPPPELHGMDLQVDFISMLAQAQRAVGTNSVDRFVGNLGQIAVMQANAGMSSTVMDKFDGDTWADTYSEMLGVDPSLVVANDKVAIVRQSRAQAQQAAQQAAMAESAANTMQKLGTTPSGNGTALDDVTRQFSGYT